MRRKWLDYLTLLLPEENLFKAALSIYDIELAEIVVKNLQLVRLKFGFFRFIEKNCIFLFF